MTTSSIPRWTRISAGASTQTARRGARHGHRRDRERARHPAHVRPVQAAQIAPASSCPSAPMFQKPARNAIATAAPVKRSGVAATSTSSP